MSQPILFQEPIETARPARPVYCHQEFLDKLQARRNEPAGKRAGLLLQRMAVDIARLHYKSTSGANRGWRRSRLGGGSGSHFYAWWAPAGAAPLKSSGDFPADSVFLRDIRHHDDHSPLNAGDAAADYLRLGVSDLRNGEYSPEPWTQPQLRFARSRGVARVLKGHPGSGKTTALLHAADDSPAERVLYLTFSEDLAGLARDYFDRFCSRDRTFTVLPFPAFIRQLAGSPQDRADPAEALAQFRRDLMNYQRSLGPWANNMDALYDEIFAHVVGAAVPEKCGRFPKAERLRLPEEAYRKQRGRFLGESGAAAVLDAVRRLERPNEPPIADRYFPELALAWRAAQSVLSRSNSVFSDYGCVAVDEVQDLTPLEAFVVLALARSLNAKGSYAPLLLAGDEAQTVRPTDFEWAWLHDMLHSVLDTPQEFKLSVNLRSPRRIADIVNRSWDYYDFLHKQDRPSGTGYAEIDDDSPDQILYAALPAGDLPELLSDLTQREGLAVIAFDKQAVPEQFRSFVLTPAEAKGLDFHSVCLLNGGPVLDQIVDERANRLSDSIARRLSIDQLRVAVSRPSERLIWVDTQSDSRTVREVGRLLGLSGIMRGFAPITGEALRASLEEEGLDIEERIQRCQRDALQLIEVKPELAWSRAHQAVLLLGQLTDLAPVTDPEVRNSAYLTLAEVCFRIAFRRKVLSPELGQPDLYEEARLAAQLASKKDLAHVILSVGAIDRNSASGRLNAIAEAIEDLTDAREELPGWMLVELTQRADSWVDELMRHIEAGDNARIAWSLLPPFFEAMGFPDAQARTDRLTERCVQILVKHRKHAQALMILEALPERKPKLEAACHEELGSFAKAAELYVQIGDRDRALKCFRSVPDFKSALALVQQMEGHSAKASLEWLAELDAVLARRPDNFNKVMLTSEKKLLEQTLERGLGVQRKKPAPKKPPARPRSKKTRD